MSTSSEPTARHSSPGASRWRVRRRSVVLAGLLVVAALAAFWVLGGRGDGGATPRAEATPGSSTATETPSAAPTPAPQATAAPPTPAPEPGSPDQLPPALPAVAFDEDVAIGDVTASIESIEEIDGRATGPGDVAGPALRITVRIGNGTGADISLDGVAVNVYHGADGTPASPLADPSQSSFAGALLAGGSAEGVYVFRVPPDERGSVTVEVGHQAGAPLAIFTGAV